MKIQDILETIEEDKRIYKGEEKRLILNLNTFFQKHRVVELVGEAHEKEVRLNPHLLHPKSYTFSNDFRFAKLEHPDDLYAYTFRSYSQKAGVLHYSLKVVSASSKQAKKIGDLINVGIENLRIGSAPTNLWQSLHEFCSGYIALKTTRSFGVVSTLQIQRENTRPYWNSCFDYQGSVEIIKKVFKDSEKARRIKL